MTGILFDDEVHPIPEPIEIRQVQIPGKEDYRRRRTRFPRCIVLHTRLGLPVRLSSQKPPDRRWDLALSARARADRSRAACYHLMIDSDGSVAQCLDLLLYAAHHAGHANEYSYGVGLYQESDGTVYQSTIDSAVLVCDALTRLAGIQRQYRQERSIIRRAASPLRSAGPAYLPGGGRCADIVGVLGHRNITRAKGHGDPGDEVFSALRCAGYERFIDDEDLEAWSERQAVLGVDVDGIAGPVTRAALERAGKPHGLWVPRPGDDR